MTDILRIESPALLYGIDSNAKPYHTTIDGWEVLEEYDSAQPEPGLRGVGKYRVVLQSRPSTSEEANELFSTGIALANLLERLWIYVVATPLSGQKLGLRLVPLLPPDGWITNYDEYTHALHSRESPFLTGKVSIGRRDWAYPGEWPLARAVDAISKYNTSDDVTKSLVELHYGAHVARGLHAKEIAFARALELVAGLLPGHGYPAKESKLPSAILASLTRPLGWLYHLSNARFNTRHVVERDKKPKLLPRMSGEEHTAFIQNSDALIRGIVSERLGLPILVIQQGTPPTV